MADNPTKPRLLVVRADASPAMGGGHVMRCLALAEAWRSAGGRALFLSHCQLPHVLGRLQSAGFPVAPLDEPSACATDVRRDIARALADSSYSADDTWVALDGYHFAPECAAAISSLGCRVLLLDDGPRWSDYRADAILNANPAAPRLRYPVNTEALLLLGSRWALLRPEFQTAAADRPARPARRLLLTSGAADAAGFLRHMLQLLGMIGLPDNAELRAIVPPDVALAEIRDLTSQLPCEVECHTNVAEMQSMMAWADLALAAAGGTCLEMASQGLPMLVTSVAENQVSVAAALAGAGAAIDLGPLAGLSATALATQLHPLLDDPTTCAAMSVAARQLVDGGRAACVVRVLLATDEPWAPDALRLRRATAADAAALWQLANDPLVRRSSLRTELIDWDDHIAWFQARLASPDSRLWLADLDGALLGQVRYDRVNESDLEVSVSIAGAFRRRGLATFLLRHTAGLALAELRAQRIRAFVREENAASIGTFLKLDYAPAGRELVAGQRCLVFEWEST